jgi:hypothetical protein
MIEICIELQNIHNTLWWMAFILILKTLNDIFSEK